MKPLFSVIIPTYNRSDKLRRALGSVEDQTFKDFEVVVCDDGSTDDTRDVVASFKDRLELTYLYEENWGGPARPRNIGIRAARAEWVCFLDADDWWYPEKLATVARSLDSADILYHDLDVYPRKALRLIRKIRGRELKSPVFVDLMVGANALSTSSVVVKKALVQEAGCFMEDKAIIGMEDYDLWLRFARISERFTYLPRSLGVYWTGETSLTEVSERQISRFTTVFQNHAKHLHGDDRTQAELLLSYSTARIKQQMGSFDEAQALFTQTAKIRDSKFRIMSRFMKSLIRCRAFLPASWIKI